MTSALKKVFDAAEKEAQQLKDDFVSTEHLLLALIQVSSSAQKILKRHQVHGRHRSKGIARHGSRIATSHR